MSFSHSFTTLENHRVKPVQQKAKVTSEVRNARERFV